MFMYVHDGWESQALLANDEDTKSFSLNNTSN